MRRILLYNKDLIVINSWCVVDDGRPLVPRHQSYIQGKSFVDHQVFCEIHVVGPFDKHMTKDASTNRCIFFTRAMAVCLAEPLPCSFTVSNCIYPAVLTPAPRRTCTNSDDVLAILLDLCGSECVSMCGTDYFRDGAFVQDLEASDANMRGRQVPGSNRPGTYARRPPPL